MDRFQNSFTEMSLGDPLPIFLKSFLSTAQNGHQSYNYTPALKKWGVYWFTSVRHSVRPSVRPTFRNSVTLFRQRFLHNLAS